MAAPETSDARAAAVVYNPTKVTIASLRKTVEIAERKAGWQPTLWFETTADDPGGGQAAAALEQGADVVMAAGGDGTVRAVAEALRGTGVPVSLLPSGTGNLLARNLDLTLDHLEQSVRTAFTGKDRKIDLCFVEAEREDGSKDSRAFLVMAGLGLDAQMLANTDPEMKRRWGWLAYVEAIGRALRDSNRLRIRYQLDDQPARTLNAHTVLIGNCGSLPGNLLLLPEAAVDDGVFDVVALRPEGVIGWFQVWVKIVWENGVLRRSQVGRKIMGMTREVRTMRYMKGTQLILRLERPQEFELDGDPFGQAIAIKVTLDHSSLVVRIPQDAEVVGAEPATTARPARRSAAREASRARQ